MLRQLAFLTLALFTLVLFQNCGMPASGKEDKADSVRALQDEIELTKQKIEDTIGLRCTQNSECAVMPVGDRACGGPRDYLIYSAGDTNVTELSRLAALSTSLEDAFNRTAEIVGICSIAMPPDVACVANVCEAL